MLIDAIFFALLIFFLVPAIGGHFAWSRGRSFWLWFFLCALLPGIGHALLLLLPDQSNPLEKELEQIRIKNGMLGIKPDAPTKPDVEIERIRKNDS